MKTTYSIKAKITYSIKAPARANLPRTAKDGADLDRILLNYAGMGGDISVLSIKAIATVGAVGTPVEEAQ